MKPILYFLLFIFTTPLWAQEETHGVLPDYPQDYFRNPLNIPIFLAGNFGECRPGHFHSGMDIKTLGEENQPVHAAADGYLSRIKMDKGGFGHALYITHPNGYTTLYAHLNKFAPVIQRYLDKEQYAKKHWDIDVQLTPSQFPVKKGQQIAWSGSTGASTAPHLHFEIRNTETEHPLNGELFGLPVIDKTPPVPTEVAIYNLDESIYEQMPVLVTLKKTEGAYTLHKSDNEHYPATNDTVDADAAILGIGMDVNDFMDGSSNTLAFLTAKLYMDDSLQSEIRLDDIGYDETRYVNAYADYKTKVQQDKWIQCFFKLPGNRLDHIYPYLNNYKGGINVTDKEIHKIRITITDDRNNTSDILFYIKPSGHFMPPATAPGAIKFNVNGENNFNDKNVSFSLDSRELYDNIFFRFKATADPSAYSDKYALHFAYVPLHHYFELRINPNKPILPRLSHKVAMMYSDDKDIDGRAAVETDSGWYEAKVRNFGTYWLDIDTTPPVIRSMQKNNSNLSKAKQITFEVRDDKTSVKSFSGYLDGKWLCFEQHGDLFFYKFDHHCPRGKHSLVFKASDENGNEQTVHLNFRR